MFVWLLTRKWLYSCKKQEKRTDMKPTYYIIDKNDKCVNVTTNQIIAEKAKECGYLVTCDHIYTF